MKLLLPLLLLSPPSTSALWPFGDGQRSVIVDIPQGRAEGFSEVSEEGTRYLSFLGIPYAEQPVKDLRFKKPEKAKKWEGTLDATRKIQCPQVLPLLELTTLGQEDCLVVNVHTKEINPSEKKAVMVWIHGGGFWFGSGVEYQPMFAMDHDIVFVSINYRLGPLGFLSSGDDVIPGNLGLWDQVMALQWVQENIAHFGGDRNKVTIFGESAGGFSVTSLLLSPRSKGLYRSAIAQSGVTQSAWSATDKHPAYYARSLAQEVGCDGDATLLEIKSCLTKVEAKELTTKGTYAFDQFEHYPHAFQPVVDNNTAEPFFPKDPYDLLLEGKFNKVPLIIGSNEQEGLFLRGQIERDERLLKQMESDYDDTLALMMFGRNADEITGKDKFLLKTVKFDYFSHLDHKTTPITTEQKLDSLCEVYEDTFFRAIGAKVGRILAKLSDAPVYEYLYTHTATFSLYNTLVTPLWKAIPMTVVRLAGFDLFPTPPASCHGDEAILMFGNPLVPYSPVVTDEDRKVNRELWRRWTDFAKTTDPNSGSSDVIWEKLNTSNPRHLEINSTPFMTGDSSDFIVRLNRWDRIWSDSPPRLHNSLQSPTWTDTTIRKGKEGETTTKNTEL